MVAGKLLQVNLTLRLDWYSNGSSVFANHCVHLIERDLDMHTICLQCFDAVGWATGRASGL